MGLLQDPSVEWHQMPCSPNTITVITYSLVGDTMLSSSLTDGPPSLSSCL